MGLVFKYEGAAKVNKINGNGQLVRIKILLPVKFIACGKVQIFFHTTMDGVTIIYTQSASKRQVFFKPFR